MRKDHYDEASDVFNEVFAVLGPPPRTKEQRTQNVEDALGSIRAEGLEPSEQFVRDAQSYVEGHLTSQELYERTLARIQAKEV